MTSLTLSSFGFFTGKHSAHDGVWLLQNSSSSAVCFACIVETLEDESQLNYRKRKMVLEILDLLTTNKLIWNLFAGNLRILKHTGKVLLKLLSTKDTDLAYLLSETLCIIVKKSQDDNGVSILDAFMQLAKDDVSNQSTISTLHICLLGKILSNSRAAFGKFLKTDQWLLERIAEGAGRQEEKDAASYWHIFSLVYRDGDSNKINTQISKLVLKSMADAITQSTTRELQLSILAVLKHFSTGPLLKELIVQHENQENNCKGKQFTEGMKKLLLSPYRDVQIGAAQCITMLISMQENAKMPTEKMPHLADKYVDKGLCEFLFELLGSSDASVAGAVLVCLTEFTNCKKFFTAGHLIYGLQPIVSFLSKTAAEQRDKTLLQKILSLILRILQKADQTLLRQGKVLHEIIKALTKLPSFQEISMHILIASCAVQLLGLLTMLDEISFHFLFKVLEDLGKILLTEAKCSTGKTSGNAII